MAHFHRRETIFKMMQNLRNIIVKCQEQNNSDFFPDGKSERSRTTANSRTPRHLSRWCSDESILKPNARTKSIRSSNRKLVSKRQVESEEEMPKGDSERSNFKDRNPNFYFNHTLAKKNPKPKNSTFTVSQKDPFFQLTAQSSQESSILPRPTTRSRGRWHRDLFSNRSPSKNNIDSKELTSANFSREKERLVYMIGKAVKENFELRESNVKLQRQFRIQNLKIRDIKYKLSLQAQISLKRKAEQKNITHLENIIRCKQLEIQDLKHEINLVAPKVTGKNPAVPKRAAKREIEKPQDNEIKAQEGNETDSTDVKIKSVKSKLTYILDKLREDAKACSTQLRYVEEQKMGMGDRFDELAVKDDECEKGDKDLKLEYAQKVLADFHNSTFQADKRTTPKRRSGASKKSV